LLDSQPKFRVVHLGYTIPIGTEEVANLLISLFLPPSELKVYTYVHAHGAYCLSLCLPPSQLKLYTYELKLYTYELKLYTYVHVHGILS